MEMLSVLKSFLWLYQMILLARVLLTWLPSIDWHNQPFRLLRDLTDPVLKPISRLLPPIGGIDFSPMVLFFLLQALTAAIPG